MKKITSLKIAIISICALMSGCTSFGGITQTQKPDTYYITTNTHLFGIFIIPNVISCSTKADSADLYCKHVERSGDK